jgi:hypothetical protein
MTSLVRLTSPRRAGSGSGMSWLAAICREVAHVMPSYAVTPFSRAISASPWARMAITRAGPVRGCVAATSRATCAMSTAPTMLRWRLLSVRFRSTRLAIWPGVAHPVGVEAVAAIAARISPCSAGQCWVGAAVWAG